MSSPAGSSPGSSDAKKEAKKQHGRIKRGIKRPNPTGSALFVGLRAADPLFQYAILRRGLGSSLLRRFGLEVLPAGAPNTGTFLDALGLSPYRLVLFSMAVGSSVKQIYWLLGIAQEEYEPAAAVAISGYNSLTNGLNSLAFTCAATSASMSGPFPQVPLVIGSLLYVTGLGIELGAEQQRLMFKKEPNNEGKAYTGGLFSLARHINYTGYALWRAGFATAAAGWTWGFFIFGTQMAHFFYSVIPSHDEYCSKRYGAQWTEFKQKTPYVLIPGVL